MIVGMVGMVAAKIKRLSAWAISWVLLVIVSTAGCMAVDGAEPNATATDTGQAASPTVVPSATSQQQTAETATPTLLPWLADLMAPAEGVPPPEQFFFFNGPDLWLTAGEDDVREVLNSMRIGPHADAPDGSVAAVVFSTEIGTRAAQEVRLVQPNGEVGDAIYGPMFLDGPGESPPVKALAWSPDGRTIALIRYDASVTGLELDDQMTAATSYSLFAGGLVTTIDSFHWSPDGQGAMLLGRDQANVGQLYVLTADGSAALLVAPGEPGSRSIGAADWIPQRGKLVVAEDLGARNNPNAGALFSINLDGSGRELLISSGQFGPTVEIPILVVSPAGDWAAFAVYAPGKSGGDVFHSLWVFEFSTNVLIPIPVNEGFRVTDVWWTSGGLIWRGVDESAPAGQRPFDYDGAEPFVLVRYDIVSGQSSQLLVAPGR